MMKAKRITRILPCHCEAWPFCEHASNAAPSLPIVKRRIRAEWREMAVKEINQHPFNPKPRYADLTNKKEICYFASIAYRSKLNYLYSQFMQRKRTSKKLLIEIQATSKMLASIGLYQIENLHTALSIE